MQTHLAEIDKLGLEPASVEDYLFKAMLLQGNEPSQALQLLNDGVNLSASGRMQAVAQLVRANIHTELAIDLGDQEKARQAVQNAAIASQLLGNDNALALTALVRANLTRAMLAQENDSPVEQKDALREAGRYVAILKTHPKGDSLAWPRVATFAYYSYAGQFDESLLRVADQLAQDNDWITAGIRLRNQYVAHLFGRDKLNDRSIERFKQIVDARIVSNAVSLPYLYLLATYANEKRTVEEYDREMSVFASGDYGIVGPMYISSVFYLMRDNVPSVESIYNSIKGESFAPARMRRDFYDALLEYNCGAILKSRLLEVAGDSRFNITEAHFFFGLKELCGGNRSAARSHFQECVEQRVWHWNEYCWSQAFLARMDQDQHWPRKLDADQPSISTP